MTAGGGGRAARRLSCEPRCSVFDAPEIQYMCIYALCGVCGALCHACAGRARAREDEKRGHAPPRPDLHFAAGARASRAHACRSSIDGIWLRACAPSAADSTRATSAMRDVRGLGSRSAVSRQPGSAPFKRTARQPRNGYTARMHPHAPQCVRRWRRIRRRAAPGGEGGGPPPPRAGPPRASQKPFT